MEKIFVVMDGNYDGEWPVAAYRDNDLAQQHATELGLWVSDVDIYSAVPEIVVSSEEKQKRTDAVEKLRAQSAERSRLDYERYQRELQTKPEDFRQLRLCHCEVYSKDEGWRITAHGYCRSCGSWKHHVIRERLGSDYLLQQISLLDFNYRKAMRTICGFQAEAEPAYAGVSR
jgi:hypothetical protein